MRESPPTRRLSRSLACDSSDPDRLRVVKLSWHVDPLVTELEVGDLLLGDVAGGGFGVPFEA